MRSVANLGTLVSGYFPHPVDYARRFGWVVIIPDRARDGVSGDAAAQQFLNL